MSCKPLLKISARSDHGQSGNVPLMKFRHDVKNLRFSLLSSFSLMTVRNSKSNLHRSYWRYMSQEPLLQISTRSDHGQSGIGHLMKSGYDEKNLRFSLFSSFFLMTFQNSKSDPHRSDWRWMSHETFLQILAWSDHRRSGIRPLMKSGQDEKKPAFFSSLLSL